MLYVGPPDTMYRNKEKLLPSVVVWGIYAFTYIYIYIYMYILVYVDTKFVLNGLVARHTTCWATLNSMILKDVGGVESGQHSLTQKVFWI